MPANKCKEDVVVATQRASQLLSMIVDARTATCPSLTLRSDLAAARKSRETLFQCAVATSTSSVPIGNKNLKKTLPVLAVPEDGHQPLHPQPPRAATHVPPRCSVPGHARSGRSVQAVHSCHPSPFMTANQGRSTMQR